MSENLSDLAAHCIRCGFCLESCPTFLITGKETESPRGRIYIIRSADAGVMDWKDPSVKQHIDTCVGCRNCETACPSGVEYGSILELARDKLEREQGSSAKKWLLMGVTKPLLMRLQLFLSRLLPGKRLPWFVSRAFTSEKPQANKPSPEPATGWPALDELVLPPLKGKVGLIMGCAMDVLFANVHVATKRLLRRVGYETVEIRGCCGALHAHNGFLEQAHGMADEILVELNGLPLIANSAGCGCFLKERVAATPTRHSQVFDLSEFLFANGLGDLLAKSVFASRVTYHDACHLAHGQRIRSEPRNLIRAIPKVEYQELAESDLCCGSGGIYNVLQPTLAREMLDRKWQNVEATGAHIVATGNPGCHAWIAQRAKEAGSEVRVLHTAELLEMALSNIIS